MNPMGKIIKKAKEVAKKVIRRAKKEIIEEAAMPTEVVAEPAVETVFGDTKRCSNCQGSGKQNGEDLCVLCQGSGRSL